MFRRILVVWVLCLFHILGVLPFAWAKDFIYGPLMVSLSDRWTVVEEPGPELLKATLGKTATLSIWKYNPGPMSADDFLSGLREDLGWTSVSGQALSDPRFGRVNAGLYQKPGAYEELSFKIRSYDFVLDGDIYVLEMRSPESSFSSFDTEFQAVFARLANLSGVTRPYQAPAARSLPPPTFSAPAVSPAPLQEAAPPPRLEPPPAANQLPYTFVYETSDGGRLGFDIANNRASVLDAGGKVKSTFPFSGTPYLSSKGVFVLTEEYAYQLDASNGNIVARIPAAEVFSLAGPKKSFSPISLAATPASSPAPSNPPFSTPEKKSSGPMAPPTPTLPPKKGGGEPGGDMVQAAILRAEDMHRRSGAKAAIDYMMGERPRAEKSGSVHLYEFYFRLGEYWEETGDLETALAYYRLATKAID